MYTLAHNAGVKEVGKAEGRRKKGGGGGVHSEMGAAMVCDKHPPPPRAMKGKRNRHVCLLTLAPATTGGHRYEEDTVMIINHPRQKR